MYLEETPIWMPELGREKPLTEPKWSTLPLAGSPTSGMPHFLQLYGIDDGRGEGGLSDESHHLGPIIHLLPQDGQQRPDYAV